MLFNSLEFAVFFVVVYALYLQCNHRWQNRLLLVASYVFYGSWDWRFLSLILFTTVLDFTCARKIAAAEEVRRKRRFLRISLAGNLLVLGFFKYFNFFSSSLQALLGSFGVSLHPWTLHIILPVGISFYTFQSLSYTIDVYRGNLRPTTRFFDYALFVSFFPQLIAGPIERASHLLPQVLRPRQVTREGFYEGCFLIFWGLFQKVFVADNLARIVDPIFSASPPYSGPLVLVALYAFAFQIYSDFAGYSNIARGLGRCMGFDIMVNFNLPYAAANPREFWRRWHISLSSWLRDYLYIPLGGNRGTEGQTVRNLALTMLLGGLWHGAAWTFVVWGAYQGLLLILHRLMQPWLGRLGEPRFPALRFAWRAIRTLSFFHLTCFGWLIFRADSLTQAVRMAWSFASGFRLVSGAGLGNAVFQLAFFTWILLGIQLWQYRKNDLMVLYKAPAWFRTLFYVVGFELLLNFGVWHEQAFIYFQF